MKGLSLATLVSVLVVTIAATAGAAEPTSSSPASALQADGKTLFARRCGICHLPDGGGTWMLERRLGKALSLLESRTDLQAPYIRLIARRGLNGMPRFTRVELPDQDLEAIVTYLTRNEPKP